MYTVQIWAHCLEEKCFTIILNYLIRYKRERTRENGMYEYYISIMEEYWNLWTLSGRLKIRHHLLSCKVFCSKKNHSESSLTFIGQAIMSLNFSDMLFSLMTIFYKGIYLLVIYSMSIRYTITVHTQNTPVKFNITNNEVTDLSFSLF